MGTWVRTSRSYAPTGRLLQAKRASDGQGGPRGEGRAEDDTPPSGASSSTGDSPEDPLPPSGGGEQSDEGAATPPPGRLWQLLPTPKGTPFTFCYTLVLVATTLFISFGDPAVVTRWLAGASTDVKNLAQEPLFVLFASALFYKGALLSVFTVGFVLVLTALERRVGGWRTAAVFIAGHVFATLATQLTVAAAIAFGHLPESSRSRFDYGIDYGVLACTAALAGVVYVTWVRWVLVLGVSTMILADLVTLQDPVVDWGHLLAFSLGIALWPLLRRYQLSGSAVRRGPVQSSVAARPTRPDTA